MAGVPETSVPSRAERILTWVVAAAGLAGAIAALAQPAGTSQSAEIAAVLALGSLALLAGHSWGMVVVTVADVVLLGTVWPMAVYADPPSLAAQTAAWIAVAGALPGCLLFARTLPGTMDLVLGRGAPRLVRTTATALSVVGGVFWLAHPILA